MLKNRIYTILFISWMMFITFSSLFSFSNTEIPKIRIPNADKVVHFVFYFVAAYLGSFFIREIKKGEIPLRTTIIVVFITMVFYGIIIEVLQMNFTLNRHGDVLDVIANSLGAFCGIFVIKYIFFKKSWLKWKN